MIADNNGNRQSIRDLIIEQCGGLKKLNKSI
jgi:hypothetical protein